MYQAIIKGTGKYHPTNIVTNEDIAKNVDTSDEWIVQRTGIKERRISEKHETCSTMAYEAAKMALAEAKMEPNDIELVLFATTIGDRFFPNTACRLSDLLGIRNNAAALDTNAACTGWMYNMTIANALIQTGVYKNILVVGCDRSSVNTNWKDRNTCILFGDGAGVVVLSRNDENSENPNAKIYSSILGADSSKQDALTMPRGGSEAPIHDIETVQNGDHYMSMDGQTVFKAAVKTMSGYCVELMKRHELTADDIDWFIPHQANLRIIEATAKFCNFPMEKVIVNVEKYANTSSASIPVCIHEALQDGRIKRGQKILMAAFGSGLTSAGMLIEF